MDPVEVRASVSLPAIPESAQAARKFIRDICNAAELGEEECATGSLLVSELVTNAVRHGASRATLEAEAPGGVLRVSVYDQSPALPELKESPDPTAESGRGLHLVSLLASRWGFEPVNGEGKVVWFELDLRPL